MCGKTERSGEETVLKYLNVVTQKIAGHSGRAVSKA
jgi:hypothetical protein